jgi:hypothetical protein
MAVASRWLTRRRLLIGGAVLLGLVAAWQVVPPYTRGEIAARCDHALGRYQIKAWGTPSPETRLQFRLLGERYGVLVDHAGDGIPTESQREYWNGYNHESYELLRARFRKDIFGECEFDALVGRRERDKQ